MNSTTVITSYISTVPIVVWNSSLLASTLAILLVGLPLSLMSFTGSLKASMRTEATIIDWLIVYFNFGIIQTCLIGQVATIARLIGHFSDKIDVHTACIVSHFSKGFGAVAVHAGLTAIAIFRFIYVLYPRLGLKINGHATLFKFLIPTLLACVAVARGLVDFFYSKSSVHSFCMVNTELTLKEITATRAFLFSMTFFFALITIDFFLTVAIWNHIRIRNVQVAVAILEVCPRQRQHNLLTLQGTVLCRMIATIGYLSYFIIRMILPDEKNPLRDHFCAQVTQNFIYACITICLPLVCILKSYRIRDICRRQ